MRKTMAEQMAEVGLGLLHFGNEVQLGGAVYTGMGKTVVVLFPEEVENHDPVEVLRLDRGEWETFLRQTDLMETEVLAKKDDGTLFKAIARKSQRQIDQVVSWSVFRRDGYRCRYCGDDRVPLTVDHLVLWEEGGPSTADNLVTACRKCNKTRGRMQYAAWIGCEYYRKVSARLPFAVREDNLALVDRLDQIQRVVHVRSR